MKKMNLRVLLIATWLVATSAPAQTVAVLGDSLGTGAGTHPELTFSTIRLWDVFNGKYRLQPDLAEVQAAWGGDLSIQELGSPRKLWPSVREYDGGFGWVFRHTLTGLSRLYLNTEEYSWGYLAARAKGRSPDAILVAAENGARTRSVSRQYDRVLSELGGQRPDDLLMLFSGNDLCGPSIDFVPEAPAYKDTLKSVMGYIMRNGDAPPSGKTSVYVGAFLGVMQLLTSEEIQNLKVQAYGKEITCRELRRQGFKPKEPETGTPELGMFAMMMPPNPAGMCPTLFAETENSTTTRASLANRIRDFRAEQKELVVIMNERLKDAGRTDLQFVYVADTAKIIFGAEDIAHDCFHLTVNGQAKIAKAMLAAW